MKSAGSELDARVLEAFEVQRSIGDVVFQFPTLREAGRCEVELATGRPVSDRNWSGLSEQAEVPCRLDGCFPVGDAEFPVDGGAVCLDRVR